MKTANQQDIFDIDQRCSTACTRAALTVLLFSIISIALIQAIKQSHNFESLAEYLVARDNLGQFIAEFGSDDCWKSPPSSGDKVALDADWSIARLMSYQCEESSNAGKIENPDVMRSTDSTLVASLNNSISIATDGIDTKSPPMPPNAISVKYYLPRAREIAEILIKLNTTGFIESARNTNYIFDRSIYIWLVRANELLHDHGVQIYKSDNAFIPLTGLVE